MPFQANWEYEPSFGFDYAFMHVHGGAKKYVIDWGDGTRTNAYPGDLGAPDGLGDTRAGHRYADGIYDVSISQGGRGPFIADWRAVIAIEDTVGQDIRGTAASDFVSAGSGNDFVSGGSGDDLLIGGRGDDWLFGGGNHAERSENDQLFGGFGDDVLLGGTGSDRLQGDAGIDRLKGGLDSDTFVFVPPRNDENTSTLPYDSDIDTVIDFVQGSDKLDVSAWRQVSRRAVEFIGQEEFHGSGHLHSEVRFEFDNSGATVVEVDFDGDGVGDMAFRVTTHVDLSATDFVL